MELVEEFMASSGWINQLRQLLSQDLYLVIIENSDAAQVSVSVKEINLHSIELELFSAVGSRGAQQISNGLVLQ